MDLFQWIESELAPVPLTSEDLIYEHMASQSGHSLPIIYRPFDVGDRDHWADRGAALDFIAATRSAGRRVLDFGPGDGWPSLIIAPYVREVIGVEGSPRRAEVCARNAARLGITNAHFRRVEPGSPLPFAADTFDAVVAASSVEQSPDPRATLAEFHRVLRPGGRLRLSYEALTRYEGGLERELTYWEEAGRTHLILYDRHIAEETAVQVRISFALPQETLVRHFVGGEERLAYNDVTIGQLAALHADIVETAVCTTHHPSGTTLIKWLAEIGFRQVSPTHNGPRLARALFDHLPPQARPATPAMLDAYLRPIIEAVVALPAPTGIDPWITAEK